MYIPSHAALGNHPKLRRLARTLAISRPAAVGHLHYLWWWSQEYAPDGDLSYHRYTAEDIADAALWEGDAYEFVDALKTSGFLDDDDGSLLIHDWDEYGGKVVRDLARDAQRKRDGRKKDVTTTSVERPPDVHRMSSVDKIRKEEIREDKRKESDADAPPVPLSDRQVKHRAMFGALSDQFGAPTDGPEKGKYEAAAKQLVQAGVDPSEIPKLCEAWAWINPGPPRVNSLASQVTVLRKARPPTANGKHPVDRATTTVRDDLKVRYRSDA